MPCQWENTYCVNLRLLCQKECKELLELARENGCVLMDAIKTAYSTAYHRMLLLIETGIIGTPKSVDATCTSIREFDRADRQKIDRSWNSISAWGPTALLPIFQIFGTDFREKKIFTCLVDEESRYDSFTKVDFCFRNAVASIKVGQGVKSEGDLIISGTKGYVYVPAPWWKTEYFEVRFERSENNRRYFYQLDGEGIRYELVSFVRSIESGHVISNVDENVSCEISAVLEDFVNGDVTRI